MDLADVVISAVNLIRQTAILKNIEIINNSQKETYVLADERMISAITRNLMMNAIKFSNLGSKIILETNIIEKVVVLKITDFGLGIKKSKLENIFEVGKKDPEFGTMGEKGSGFGLIVCRDFIKLNNGTISIESKEGIGTTVSVSLPSC